jgi:hypothetical protein
MTPSDMIIFGKDLLGEVQGTPGDASPLTWRRWLIVAAKELCQATDCLYRDYAVDLVSGQALYCASPLYKLVGATCAMQDGSIRRLSFRTARSLVDNGNSIGVNFAVAPSAASGPLFLATEGDNRMVLSPVPTYSTVAFAYTDLVISGLLTVSSVLRPFIAADVGLTLRVSGGAGFTTGNYLIASVAGGIASLAASPGVVASVGGAATLAGGGLTVEGYGVLDDSWADAQAVDCPLPARAHEALVYKAALLRCLQFPSPYPGTMQMLQQQFTYHKGMLEGQVAVMTSANRQRMTEHVGPRFGSYGF